MKGGVPAVASLAPGVVAHGHEAALENHGREEGHTIRDFSLVAHDDLELERSDQQLRVQVESPGPHALPHALARYGLRGREGDVDLHSAANPRVDQPAGVVALVAHMSLALGASALAAGTDGAAGGQARHVLVGVAAGLDFVRVVTCGKEGTLLVQIITIIGITITTVIISDIIIKEEESLIQIILITVITIIIVIISNIITNK